MRRWGRWATTRRWRCSRTGRQPVQLLKHSSRRVTNPPWTAFAKRSFMSMDTTIGREFNLLHPTPQSCPADQAEVADPEKRRSWTSCGRSKARRMGASSPSRCRRCTPEGRRGRAAAGDQALCRQASTAIATGTEYIIHFGPAIDKNHAPDPPGPARNIGSAPPSDSRGTRRRSASCSRAAEPREVHLSRFLIGLRGWRDQPVPRLRDDRRHDPAGHISRWTPRRRFTITSSR